MEISVIMPVYKVEKYLRRAIDSVLAQTFKDFELIIVDDGSPDNCPKICDEYADKDSRIKVIHKENGGLSSARNAGLDIARGKWIAFIDSDDMYKRDMLMKMWTRGDQDGEIDYVHCGVELVGNGYVVQDGDLASVRQPFDGIRTITDEVITSSNPYIWNKLFRADIVNSYKLRFPMGLYFEDFFFYNVFALVARKVGFISDKLYVYSRHSQSITTKVIEGDTSYIDDHIVVWRRTVDFLRQAGKLQEKSHLVFCLLMMCLGAVNCYGPSFAKWDRRGELLAYADIDVNKLLFAERVDMFWWRHGKPGGGSIKYLGGLFKLQLRERKIVVRFLGIKIFSINLMACE